MIGAVLCGGRSTRMGHDKATLEVAGRPMAAWVVDALQSAGLEEVVALGGSALPGIEVIPDLEPDAGPLSVLIGALERRGSVLVCPCDVPTAPASLFRRLLEVADAHDAGAVLARSDRIEPLIGIYQLSALPTLRAGRTMGAQGPSQILGDLSLQTVDVDLGEVHNVNTPADLAIAEQILASRRH